MPEPDVETFEATDFLSVLDAIEEIDRRKPGMIWWRGQGYDWSLRPQVFRGGPSEDPHEANIAHSFRRLAPARYDNCPDWEDLPRWLVLMQHFRVPTRLLDWTESPLVGLFFAVDEQIYATDNGVLWALDAFRLNGSLHGETSTFLVEHDTAAGLLTEAYTSRAANQETAAALAPEELDPRMMLQLGGFTVHGSPKPLEQLEGVAPHLKKIIITQDAKLDAVAWLDRLGIKRRNLFPDLHNLSKEIREYAFFQDPPEDDEED